MDVMTIVSIGAVFAAGAAGLGAARVALVGAGALGVLAIAEVVAGRAAKRAARDHRTKARTSEGQPANERPGGGVKHAAGGPPRRRTEGPGAVLIDLGAYREARRVGPSGGGPTAGGGAVRRGRFTR